MDNLDSIDISLNDLNVDNGIRIKERKDQKVCKGITIDSNINKNSIFKILKYVCENRSAESIKIANKVYSVADKDIFNNAKKCLILKNRIDFIDSIIN